MIPTLEQIAALREDFCAAVAAAPGEAVGASFRQFFCPVLHEDGLGERGLMEGHVLPQGLKVASRATVIQRADVDNYFGETIEPDLIKWLNLPKVSLKQLLGHLVELRAAGRDGSDANVFFANPKSKP